MCIITITYSYYCCYCINTKEYSFLIKSTTRTVSYRTREETVKPHRPHEWEYAHVCVRARVCACV